MLQAWENLWDCVRKHDGCLEMSNPSRLNHAMRLTRKRHWVDEDGVSMHFLQLYADVDSIGLCHFVNIVEGSTGHARQLPVRGRILGKSSHFPVPDEARAIVPQGCLQTLPDITGSLLLIEKLDRIFLEFDTVHVAG